MSAETESTHRSLISLRKLLLIHCAHVMRTQDFPRYAWINVQYFHNNNDKLL